MAKQIVWTRIAQNDRKLIFEYWNNRNQSFSFSKKLNQLFITNLNLIAEKSFIGRRTNVKNVRAKVVRDYLLFYEITERHIVVLTIWDCRKNPQKLHYSIE